MKEGYADELGVAVTAVQEACRGYLTADHQSVKVKTNAVGSYDIVTRADEQAQALLMRRLGSAFPDDRFIAEEGQERSLTGARTWVIDPIDGTLSYQRGMPLFGTQLALLVDREPVLSVICLPVLGETYTAAFGGGVLCNGLPLPVCPLRDLKECVISTGDFSRKRQAWRDKQYELIGGMREEVARIRMLGAACCDFAFFAAGRLDMHMRFVNNLWDFMPGLFLARMAGAYVDEELLRDKQFLLLAHGESEARQYRERVLKCVQL